MMEKINKFYDELKDIKYGWHDEDGNIHEHINKNDFVEKYCFQDAEKIKISQYAICWEMCELERDYFLKHNIKHYIIMAIINDKNFINHTFAVLEYNDKFYWFEVSWQNKKGIHEFNSLEEILEYFKGNFKDFTKKDYNPATLEFFEYPKPSVKSCTGFLENALIKGKKIG